MSFPGGSDCKESTCNTGDLGLILDKRIAGGEGDDRGWDGWMAPPTQWTWVWVNSGSWWWTGRPGVLQFTGSQRVGHDWVTELKRLATHSSILSWRIPWTEEPGGLQSMGSQTVGHSWVTNAFTFLLLLYNWNILGFSSVQFSRSVVSDSLWPHEL